MNHLAQQLHDEHAFVETKQGRFAVLPDTNRIVPIYLATALPEDSLTTPDALESLIGRPEDYVARTTRLYVVLPNTSVNDLRIDAVNQMLLSYATVYDLSAKLVYYRGAKAVTLFSNRWPHDYSQPRLSIDILPSEVFAAYAQYSPGKLVMNDMHISPDPDNKDARTNLDFHGMARRLTLQYPRNAEYDFNTFVVVDIVNGRVRRTQYPISNIYIKQS